MTVEPTDAMSSLSTTPALGDAADVAARAARRQILLVTGLAGAGRSTALKCLEDHGFEAVDNLPLALLPHLVSGVTAAGEAPRALAIGIDGRTRDFTAEGLAALAQDLKRDPALDVRLLFLDSDDET